MAEQEATITLPDGRKATLRGPNREAIMQQAERIKQAMTPQPPAGSTTGAVAGAAGERLIDNALGLPNAALRMANPLANRARGAMGQPERPAPQVPVPSGRQVASGIEAGAQTLMGEGMPTQAERQQQGPGTRPPSNAEQVSALFRARMQHREAQADDRPLASSIGSGLGDAATIMAGRAPLVRGPGGLFDNAIDTGINNLVAAVGRGPNAGGARRAGERFLGSDKLRGLARGAGRAAETGIEAGALSILQDGDPTETAMFAAGGQASASLANTVLKDATDMKFLRFLGPVKGRLASAALTAGVTGGLVQLAKAATPGGRDRILESAEAGFDKVVYSFLFGATVGVMGRRAKVDGIMREFPRLADAAATLPRAGMIKLAQAMAGDPDLERTVQSVAENPRGFTRAQIDSFNSAVGSNDPAEQLRRLLEGDESFRDSVSAPDPRLIGVPMKRDQ